MKPNIYLQYFLSSLIIFSLFHPVESKAQLAAMQAKSRKHYMTASVDQKVTLIFPEAVSEAVAGNSKVNIVKANNKCFVSAVDNKGFPATNIFISLASGHYYDLHLRFKFYTDTTLRAYNFEDADGIDTYVARITKDSVAELVSATPGGAPFKLAEEFIKNSNLVLEKPVFFTDKGAIGQNLIFFLQSIYQENNKMYVRIAAKNFSNIAYDIREIKFHLVPTKGFLNTLTTERQEIKPVFVLNGHKNKIDPKATISKVFVFEDFKLTDKNQFSVDIFEGSANYRQIQFSLSKQDMEKALALNK